ncbi:C40 family peptidase [Bacillus infantis]|jgi:cell wall-associated NlpC family hydrolase|uniref:C40 family peptidase n=1 Tax=Bacillus infantis TaxID=324767 RepID=UPI001CD38A20|nr:C40 family peptidase [Bacillus infantis]MCA1041642.1 C40 family peptidase [Bacillus infantis]
MLKRILTVLGLAFLIANVVPATGEAASYHTKAINVAKNNLGIPYKWGGITKSGFDCSGLVKYSYNIAGRTLPRTASDMYKKGTKVSALSPGDLMFFAPYKGANPTHVSIYMGSGKMIHAASSRGVSVSYTNNTYWQPKFIGAKRI